MVKLSEENRRLRDELDTLKRSGDFWHDQVLRDVAKERDAAQKEIKRLLAEREATKATIVALFGEKIP